MTQQNSSYSEHHAIPHLVFDSSQNEVQETRILKSMTFNAVGAHFHEQPQINYSITPALGIQLDKDKSTSTKVELVSPLGSPFTEQQNFFSPRLGEGNFFMNKNGIVRSSQHEPSEISATKQSKLEDKSTQYKIEGKKRSGEGMIESNKALRNMIQSNKIPLSESNLENSHQRNRANLILSSKSNEPKNGTNKQKDYQINDGYSKDPPLTDFNNFVASSISPNTNNQQISNNFISKPNNFSTQQVKFAGAQNQKQVFDKTQNHKRNSTYQKLNLPQYPQKDSISLVHSSLHMHRLSLQPEYLKQEKIKIIVVLSTGIIIGILQIIGKNESFGDESFKITAASSILAQIICLIPLIIRLEQIASGILTTLQKSLYLSFFLISNFFRVIVLTSNYIRDTTQVQSIEVLAELFISQQLIFLVLSAFPIFRIKQKAYIFYSLITVVSLFNLLFDKTGITYFHELILSLVVLILFLLRLFLFKEFPFNICSIYNAQHEAYDETKKSYLSLMLSESSQYASRLNAQLSKEEKSHNIDPSEIWRLKVNESHQQRLNLGLDEISIKHEAKKMLLDTSVIAFINSNLNPTYFSNKMKNEIEQLFINKEGGDQQFCKDPLPQYNPQMQQQAHNESMAHSRTHDMGRQKLQQFQTQNQTQQQIQATLQEQTTGDQSNKRDDRLSSDFKILMEKMILERVDNDTLHCWELLRKASQNNQVQEKYQYPQFKFLCSYPVFGENSPVQAIKQQMQEGGGQTNSTFVAQPLHLSQNLPPSNQFTFRDFISARNSFHQNNKTLASTITQNNIGYSQRIGLKSKYIMISLQDFLEKIQNNPVIFSKFNSDKPIVIASFLIEGEFSNKTSLQKYQIKIYPKWENSGDQVNQSLSNSIQSIVGMSTSKKFHFQENVQEIMSENNKGVSFLIVFEEIQERESIVNKAQFYKFLKSIFRCFNNDLIRSLANILGTSQAGALSSMVKDDIKDQFIRPILLSCKIIKYILHNLRDFNDIIGEKFQLEIRETSIPKVAEDVVMLFKATSNQIMSFKVFIEEDVPMLIWTDQRRLVQIILTLLSNAHKHTQSGSLTFRIFHPKIGDVLIRNLLRFQIEDTGDGMEDSVQDRLAKLFTSGIGYQDFKTISAFGFNLFICNILAKKLFHNEFQFQFQDNNKDFYSEQSQDKSGIKFTSNLGQGSIFYFDIKLMEERKTEKLQDSIINYLGNNQQTVLEFSSFNVLNNRKSLSSFNPQQILSIPSDRYISNQPQKKNRLKRNSTNQVNEILDIPDEESKLLIIKIMKQFIQYEASSKDKYDSRIMTFQSQPKGLHSDYKFLKCNCTNVLIIDKVQGSLDSMEIMLKSYHFLAKKCRTISEAKTSCREKNNNDCFVCNMKSYACIFVSIEEFYKQNGYTFMKEFEDFSNSIYCKDSILIAVANIDSPAKRWLETLKIDDYLNTTFDNIEFFNIIEKWKLLPQSDSVIAYSSIAFSKITNSKNKYLSQAD